MRFVFLIILFIIFGYSLALVFSNTQEIAVNLLFIQAPAMNVALVLIIALSLGILIGLLLGLQLFRVFQINWENKRLQKEVKNLRKEQVELATKAASLAKPNAQETPDASVEMAKKSKDADIL